jgi:hypothetical protein
VADQGKWFKLWESALDDQELENLSIHQWFCWARLGTYVKKHGKDGELVIKAPATALQNLLRLGDFEAVINVIKMLPGYVLENGALMGRPLCAPRGAEESPSETANVTNASVSLKIKCTNWLKYQGDFSTERVRKHRRHETVNVTVQEERRGDVEEKRGDVSPQPPMPSANSTSKPNGKRGYKDPEIPEDQIMTGEDLAKMRQEIKKTLIESK